MAAVGEEEEGKRSPAQRGRGLEVTDERVAVDVDPPERNPVALEEVAVLVDVRRAAAADQVCLAAHDAGRCERRSERWMRSCWASREHVEGRGPSGQCSHQASRSTASRTSDRGSGARRRSGRWRNVSAVARPNLIERRMAKFLSEPPTVRGAVEHDRRRHRRGRGVSGVLISVFDHQEFDNVWLGMWWAIQTVTTVGYGDVTPVDVVGRIIAAVVMLQGIAFLAIVTAAITSTFVARATEEHDAAEAKDELTRAPEDRGQIRRARPEARAPGGGAARTPGPDRRAPSRAAGGAGPARCRGASGGRGSLARAAARRPLRAGRRAEAAVRALQLRRRAVPAGSGRPGPGPLRRPPGRLERAV